MTVAVERRFSNPFGRRAERAERVDRLPSLSERLDLARTVLVVVFVVSGGLLLQLTVVSSFQHRAKQQQLFDSFRAQLALGTAPLGPTDIDGREVPIGAPVAYIEVPSIGLRQVVVEGSTSGALLAGPGHRRDSPLPGQAGVSIIMGRQAAYGGPFSRIDELDADAPIRVTTGQGVFEYRVMGVRREGDPLPSPARAGESRLLLATADGRRFVPNGVLRIDAELDKGEATAGPRRLVNSTTLPAAEELMATDTSRLWALALWLEVLVVVAVGAVWAWHRWGRVQAWVVFLPPLLLVGLLVSNQAVRLLPNLL